MHTEWSKGADAIELKPIWWAWLVAEPEEFLGRKSAPRDSHNATGDDTDAEEKKDEAKRFPDGMASSSRRSHAIYHDIDCADDDDSPLPRRCALEGKSHFPPTQAPDDETIAEMPTVEDIMDLTQNCRLS